MVAFLNYIFHPVLGRILSPAEFGDVQAFISLLTQAGILFGAFSVVTVNLTTNTENPRERNAIILELQKIAIWIVIFIFIVLIVSVFKLKSFFNFSSVYPLIGLAVTLPISAINIFRNAYLQGSSRFAELSFSGVISSLGRLVFAVILILIGWGTFGATLGIILANIAVMFFLLAKTHNSLNLHDKTNIHVLEKGSIIKELKYGLLVLFATGLVIIFYTIDVLIVKRYFGAEEAGLYSGISAIAKIMFFVIGPSAAVLLSSVKVKNSFGENSLILKKSIFIGVFIGAVGLLAFSIFHDILIQVMIGGKYVTFAYLLPKIGWVMFLSATMNIFVYYFLALRRFFLIFISLFGVVAVFFIMFGDHASIEQIISNLSVVLVIINLSFILVYAKDYFRNHSSI